MISRGPSACRDRVRHHRRELRRLALLDEQDALAELQPGGARQHGEPLVPRVHAELVRSGAAT